MIDHVHKCIFIHPPRTGGTSLEYAFTGADWLHLGDEKHLCASEARSRYAKWWDDYYKFVTVRNPYERAVSIYAWNTVTPPRPSFKAWSLSQSKNWFRNYSMNRFIDLPLESFDFVVRFERYQQDYFVLKKRFHLGPLPHALESRKKKDYRVYYDRQMYLAVTEGFKVDFERFGYPADEFEFLSPPERKLFL